MNPGIPPKMAVISSFAGYGRCSMTEALPIISAMKVQACPVPTSIFSNHTGFESHFCQDFTSQLPDYLAQWERLGIGFDGIYCGFLGKREQIPIIADFIQKQKAKGCRIVLVDPVMGDHGKAYKTVSREQCKELCRLVHLADIITPNMTEACLLTGAPYHEAGWQPEELAMLCQKLHAMGPARVVITGLCQDAVLPDGCTESCFLNFISTKNAADGTIRTDCDITPAAGPSRHGTGDIFASILAADAVKGNDLTASVHRAATFIADCIRASEALGIPEPEGVCFENHLDRLA